MSEQKESMKEPTTPEEVSALHKLLRSDPQRYLRIVNEWIAENPNDHHAYFERHYVWMKLGEPQRALDDLNITSSWTRSRWCLCRAAKSTGCSANTKRPWRITAALRPLIRRNGRTMHSVSCIKPTPTPALGDEKAALACCARLPDDFWTPGMNSTPSGGKAEIAEKVRQIAAEVRRRCI